MNLKIILKFIALIVVLLIATLLLRTGDFSIWNLRSEIESYGMWAPTIFVGLFVLGTVMFLPATPFDLFAGAVFGTFWGFVYIIIGSMLGSSLTFFLSRLLGKEFVDKLINGRFKKIKKYETHLVNHGFRTILILRLIPFFPFNGLNFAFGLTKVRFRDYFFGTLIGIIPGAFSLVFFSESVVMMNYRNVVISVLLIVFLFTLIVILKKNKKFKNLNK